MIYIPKAKILGLDPGREMGWAYRLIEQDAVYSGTAKSYITTLPPGLRFQAIADLLHDMILNVRPVMIYAERPHLRGWDATRMHMGFHTELLRMAGIFGTPVKFVHTSTVKKFATGSGRATKQEILKALADRGLLPKTDHEADALCIMLYGEEKEEA